MDNSKNLGEYLGKGNSIAHRHKGSVNRNTKALQVIKDRIIETVGKLDKASKNGDWLLDLAKSKPKLFVELLKRVLPTTGTLELPGAVTLQIIKTYERSEDHLDIQDAKKALKDPKRIPWSKIKKDLEGPDLEPVEDLPKVIKKDDNNSTTSDGHAATDPVTPSD